MKDLLQAAARSGSGNAARALGGGLAGMRTGTRRFLITGAVVLLLVYLGWDMFSGVMGTVPSDAGDARVAPVAIAASVPTTSPTAIPATPPGDATKVTSTAVGYSIDISEIAGLAVSTPPGTVVDIWVTWDPPLTKVPKLQRLLGGAVVERIAPPVTPQGPHVAMLSIPAKHADDLLWADRYGSLSATTTQGP